MAGFRNSKCIPTVKWPTHRKEIRARASLLTSDLHAYLFSSSHSSSFVISLISVCPTLMDPPNPSLPYPDFLESEDLPSFTTPNHSVHRSTQIFSANQPFKSPSPTPSPANLNFNPDDFLASPPHASAQALTPELKRRLFSNDPIPSAPNTGRKTALATALFSLPSDHQSPAPTPNRLPPPPPIPKLNNVKTKCNCKASKCLKLYCPCFAASEFCAETCTCKNCQNSRATSHAVRDARETVLARDPRAFEPKVRNSTSAAKNNIHTKGCNCRKGCSKNYCVCRELRVPCGPRCTCSGPKGCLNGKTDVILDRQLQGSADDIIGITNIGPPPSRFLNALPPPKFSRMKQTVKQKREKKRNDLSTPPKMQPFLSPSFPSLSIDSSPQVDLQNFDEFRKLMGDVGFVTPFTLRKAPFRPMEDITPNKEGKRPLSTVLEERSGVDIAPLSVKRRISLEVLDDPKQEPSLISQDAKRKPQSKRIRMHADLIDVNQKMEPTESIGNDDRTPENQGRKPDIKFTTSPTTGEKDDIARSSGLPLFGRQDKIEVCRLPRILRVKMGSGKPLRKFDL